jgi:single-strand DNA-binding protein
MNSVLNLSLLEGRLTRDPKLFYTKNGIALCKFDIAVNYRIKSGDKFIDDVSYISVDTWNKVAENCAKYLKKGNFIRVKGRLRQARFEAKDGTKKNKVSVDASGVDFLSYPARKKEKSSEKIPF